MPTSFRGTLSVPKILSLMHTDAESGLVVTEATENDIVRAGTVIR